ncbi:hypothetical protein B0J13DRAFT_563402 [Dactylonectria estremocensis]|uniref:Uncharacterized protein n=1 Tax=Dactylonectria estremocensis TaxID=1079267 RepID=A0A9P9E324_9HYPO|nr:hypothetical protein B0J13DRAFT_563402 [Dactylonectria estremocensis]
MPVTLSVVDHPAQSWPVWAPYAPQATTPEDLLKEASPEDFHRCKRIIQSSFSDRTLEEHRTSASKNGFVWAAYEAYSHHHHLTLRPEDIWFAIITQLSSYINTNAEKLRSYFAAHDGQKHLTIQMVGGSISTVDFGDFAQQMSHLIDKNVKDAELRAWIMPAFSTTTDTDRVVASVLFMGAMQKYFSYEAHIICGIPSITLLGEVTDYQNILARLDKLEQLGDEPTQFAVMLRPILRRMILSFREPTNPEVVSFWNKIANQYNLCGDNSLTGWITAFCYWDAQGKARFTNTPPELDFDLDGVRYLKVKLNNVPAGCVTVPVKVDDDGTIYKCRMLAGSLGVQGLPENPPQEPPGEKPTKDSQPALTRIRPLTGWAMYETKPDSNSLWDLISSFWRRDDGTGDRSHYYS